MATFLRPLNTHAHEMATPNPIGADWRGRQITVGAKKSTKKTYRRHAEHQIPCLRRACMLGGM